MKIQNGFSLVPLTPEQKMDQQKAQLRDAAQMYENHFLNEMVKSMRKTVPREGGMMAPNFAEKIFSEQLDQKYVQNWSERGGVGLADMIYKQISEKYFSQVKKDFGKAPGALPLAPSQSAKGMPVSDSIQMKVLEPGPEAKLQYRFEVQDPSGGFDVKSPLPGRVLDQAKLADGWSVVRLDHGEGVQSELTFPGSLTENVNGADVGTGQKLGALDSSRPVLAWKLDWT